MTDFPTSTAFRRQAEKAISLQLGMATPLWAAFGAAASAGVAWWWMTRAWRPTNLEATALSAGKVSEMAEAPPTADTAVKPSKVAKPEAAKSVETVAVIHATDPAEDAAVAEEVFADAESAGSPGVTEEPHAPPLAAKAELESDIPAETAETPEAALAADDLTQLSGIGPRIAAALAERSVTRFAELAQWTADDLAAFDQELNLRGRALRSNWIDQARKLAAPN